MDNAAGAGEFTLEVVRGDITRQPDVEAIVNAANAELMPGGGVAGAIHRAAGPGLAAECRPLAPIVPGAAVLTGGYGLPNRWVIHCLGPVYGRDEPAAELLAACYRNALQLAGAQGIHSIAFPAISTGVFGYPPAAAARVSIDAVRESVPLQPVLNLVRFVLFDGAAQAIFERVLYA
jgi:O-acetyl-ADP-ribose deacetylase (regulator of RNase III)